MYQVKQDLIILIQLINDYCKVICLFIVIIPLKTCTQKHSNASQMEPEWKLVIDSIS